MQVYGSSKVGSSKEFVYWYGLKGGKELFGNIEAPSLFKSVSWSRHYNLWSKDVSYSIL